MYCFLDVTERHDAEKNAAGIFRQRFHELKTPLQSISGYSEIIKDGIAKPEDIKRFAERIYMESSRMITLIDDIIKLSMLDEADRVFPFEEVDLYETAKQAVSRLAAYAEKMRCAVVSRGGCYGCFWGKAAVNRNDI